MKKPVAPIQPMPMHRQSDVPIAAMLPNADNNIFCLVRIAMIRALDIHGGSKPLVEHDPLDKPTSIALHEIAQSKVIYKHP